ncbi:MAG TPA: erythromycin esterase family protein [Candidatus Dormibacteraeota bacterium]|nr:erythromycin esterase family protein [Candidatus Dormibacteraeota bacterium]
MHDPIEATAKRLFRDRRDAGRVLAGLLNQYRDRADVIVLALPRGGVPVAYEVAASLGVPLDIFLVRKLGVPGHEELAMGALASGGVVVLNDDVVRGLDIGSGVIRRVAEREAAELRRREREYRGRRPPPEVAGKVVILVDDGLATGASMLAAVDAIRQQEPGQIVVAVPAAPESTCRELREVVDAVVCATTPSPFFAVGQSYWDFSQTDDDEVRHLLREAWTNRLKSDPRPPRLKIAEARPNLDPVVASRRRQDALLDLVGDAHFVLLGEASHGTHEFYAERAAITRRLIEEKGFCAVAAEADWPDAYRVNRFVRGLGADPTAERALLGFERFPTWMWRNSVVLEFVGWLRDHNADLAAERKAGFYGLDLYGMYRAIDEILAYLARVDPAAAERARERFACFDHYDGDAQRYGYAAAFGAGESCETVAVEQLADLHQHRLEYARRDGLLADDELFHVEMSMNSVKAAEEYYRTMFGAGVSSWNLRDTHMSNTLDALAEHLGRRRGEPARVVVWAHNSHVGDSRATERDAIGELTLGRLVRERHPGDCLLGGFTTYSGTVTAADDWGAPVRRKKVRPATDGSVEEMFHRVGEEGFAIPFPSSPGWAERLRTPHLERAIGVIYRPGTERQSHYFRARMSDQFDIVIHIDETRAVEPLERSPHWDAGEPPETFPYAV